MTLATFDDEAIAQHYLHHADVYRANELSQSKLQHWIYSLSRHSQGMAQNDSQSALALAESVEDFVFAALIK